MTGATKRYPSQNQERIIIRLPDGMRDKLAAFAKRNNRSVNAEMILCIENHLAETKLLGGGMDFLNNSESIVPTDNNLEAFRSSLIIAMSEQLKSLKLELLSEIMNLAKPAAPTSLFKEIGQ